MLDFELDFPGGGDGHEAVLKPDEVFTEAPVRWDSIFAVGFLTGDLRLLACDWGCVDVPYFFFVYDDFLEPTAFDIADLLAELALDGFSSVRGQGLLLSEFG